MRNTLAVKGLGAHSTRLPLIVEEAQVVVHVVHYQQTRLQERATIQRSIVNASFRHRERRWAARFLEVIRHRHVGANLIVSVLSRTLVPTKPEGPLAFLMPSPQY